MLLGRKTYEGLAAFWLTQTGPWADLLNSMPKFVASRTFQGSLDWNASVIEGDLADGISSLKEELDGDVILIGCGELARNLVAAGLIDELRFWVHPAGRRRAAVPGRRASPARPGRIPDVRLGRHAAPLRAGGLLVSSSDRRLVP
jgi:dihydrofolate reductase